VHAKQNELRKKEHSSARDPHTHAENRRTQSSSGNLEGLFLPSFSVHVCSAFDDESKKKQVVHQCKLVFLLYST